MERNIRLYPWFKFFQNLLFWQAIWFLYFQQELSAAEAILLYACYDIATTLLEVPSGYVSDRLGRRITLILAAVTGIIGPLLIAVGDGFSTLLMGQVFLGASAAFASGTDTSLLYESLAASNRADETEQQELRAWRFGFIALALSAVVGGGLAVLGDTLPFLFGALAFVGALAVAMLFKEPPHDTQQTNRTQIASLRSSLSQPVLIWLFVLSVLMYGFSHIPFVFGQPFIQDALMAYGFEAEAPLVSGAVSAAMMVLSVLTSLVALSLRRRIGLPAILLFAFAMQIMLIAVLMATNALIAIAFLLLRMVPDSLSWPFILARIQPLLQDESRATYLSLQSFFGRLFFAGSLFVASGQAPDGSALSHPQISSILGWYVAVGVVFVTGLAIAARRLPLENQHSGPKSSDTSTE